jgi:hypothetical protein
VYSMSDETETAGMLTEVFTERVLLEWRHEWASRNQPPDTLFHYTTGDGLFGILGSKTLYATDARYVNDSTELIYPREVIESLIERKLSQWPSVSAQSALTEMASTWREGLFRSRVYIFCFCEEGDLLSQWRGYGGMSGYSVGMAPSAWSFDDPAEFRGMFDPSMHLVKVRYDPESQLNLVEGRLDAACHFLTHFDAKAQVRDGMEFCARFVAAMTLAELAKAALCLKHPAFSEEREWRLVYAEPLTSEPTEHKPQPVHVRAFLHGLRPYVHLPLDFKSGEAFRPCKVFLAPSNDAALQQEALDCLLAECGFSGTPIGASSIPFRA